MVAIPFFPGTNCERDTLFAMKELGAQANLIWHKEDVLPLDTKLVIIPGGFSYGDYLRSGAIAHFSPIMQAIKEFAKNGGYVLGICNGFQILLESGLLPGAMKRNENLHFISDWVSLTVANNDNAFLADCKVKDELYMPIAHAEGNYFCDDETLKTLTANNQIILTYKDGNINGATANIAGICDTSKRIFGLMPHPERATNKILGGSDGAILLGAILQRSGCVS
jgi:phosphoribosylformylglycinamidine synthase I